MYILKKYLKPQVMSRVELGRIWDAYRSLLIDEALNENIDSNSGISRMISVKKLYKEARMYMNIEELEAIQQGKIKEYLLQFNSNEEDESEKSVDLDNLDDSHLAHLGADNEENFDDEGISPVK
jgi:hypothetical protein